MKLKYEGTIKRIIKEMEELLPYNRKWRNRINQAEVRSIKIKIHLIKKQRFEGEEEFLAKCGMSH